MKFKVSANIFLKLHRHFYMLSFPLVALTLGVSYQLSQSLVSLKNNRCWTSFFCRVASTTNKNNFCLFNLSSKKRFVVFKILKDNINVNQWKRNSSSDRKNKYIILPLVLNIGPNWIFFLERLRLRNRLLNDDIFDIFLDYPLVYR